jgi:hypothetical protein
MILFMASLKLCHRWLKKLYFTLSRRASARGGFLFWAFAASASSGAAAGRRLRLTKLRVDGHIAITTTI